CLLRLQIARLPCPAIPPRCSDDCVEGPSIEARILSIRGEARWCVASREAITSPRKRGEVKETPPRFLWLAGVTASSGFVAAAGRVARGRMFWHLGGRERRQPHPYRAVHVDRRLRALSHGRSPAPRPFSRAADRYADYRHGGAARRLHAGRPQGHRVRPS